MRGSGCVAQDHGHPKMKKKNFFFAYLISLFPRNYVWTLLLPLDTSVFGRMTLTSASAEHITGRRFFPPLSDGAACLRHSRVGEEAGEEGKKLWGRRRRWGRRWWTDAHGRHKRVIKAKMYWPVMFCFMFNGRLSGSPMSWSHLDLDTL